MATYYAELTGGEIVASVGFEGGVIYAEETLSGGDIYPSGGGGGGANLETLTLFYTPSETAISETRLPSAGYDGFDEVDVSVDAIPSNYVGSGVPRRDSLDLTTSGATVNVPSGFYEYNSSATIPSAPLPTISSATINSSGTLGVVANLSSDGYLQSGTLPLTLTNAFTVKGAQTYTPGTTDQSIAADQYLSGAQTILGDADLVAGNIKKDVNIFGVVGTYEGGGGGGSAITVTDTIDPVSGGTIREITGVDISNDTVTADKLAYGYTAHMADGTAITGTRRFWVEITIPTDGAVTQALDPYVLYHFTGNLTSLTITLNPTSDIAHYHFDFLSGSTAPTLTMPNTVTMPDSFSVEASKRYEVDVLNNYGSVIAWTE